MAAAATIEVRRLGLFALFCSALAVAVFGLTPSVCSARLSQGGGQRWVRQYPEPSNAALRAVSFVDSAHGWAVGSVSFDGSIVATGDGGSTWTLQLERSDLNLTDVAFTDTSHGWAVGWRYTGNLASEIFATSDGGRTWQTQLWTRPSDGVWLH